LADFFFFFSSSFFKRLEANISLLAATLLLAVSVCFLPTSVLMHSSGRLPFDVHSLEMGDGRWIQPLYLQ
jgi:hypothetical protein